MATYKCTYYFEEGGMAYAKYIVAESEGDAGEQFDSWTDTLETWPQLLSLEEVS